MLVKTSLNCIYYFHGKIKTLSYSSTDIFLSPILVSDWLIFFCANLITEIENDKNKFFNEKQQKNAKKSICKLRVELFTLN